MRRSEWQRRKYPKEVERVDRVKKSLAATERAGMALVQFVTGIADDPAVILADAAATAANTVIADAEKDAA